MLRTDFIGALVVTVVCIVALPANGGTNTVVETNSADAPSATNTYEEPMERGRAAFDRRDWRTAVREFSEAIRLDPTKAVGFGYRGDAFLVGGQVDRAIADFTTAIKIEPTNEWAYFNRGSAYRAKTSTEALDNALKACELAQWKRPDYIDTLAAAYAESGDFEKAVQYQKRALSMPADPSSGAAPATGSTEGDPDQMRKRLLLYERNRPFRQLLGGFTQPGRAGLR